MRTDPVRVLIGRRVDGEVAVQLTPRDDPVAVAGRVYSLADPDFNAATEWCVVEAADARWAKWPNPEPWRSG